MITYQKPVFSLDWYGRHSLKQANAILDVVEPEGRQQDVSFNIVDATPLWRLWSMALECTAVERIAGCLAWGYWFPGFPMTTNVSKTIGTLSASTPSPA